MLRMQIPEVDIKQLFDNVNIVTNYIINSSETYKDFLRFSGGFINEQGKGECYTIANQLLIYGFNNQARLVMDERAWDERGVHIIKPFEPIHVMQKTKEGYKDRVVYDISSTDAVISDYIHDYKGVDQGVKCEALIRSSPCKIEYSAKTPPGRADYSFREDRVTFNRGFRSLEWVYMELSRVYGHYYLCQNESKNHIDKYKNKTQQDTDGKLRKQKLFKSVDGKFYELSPTDIVKKDSRGHEFVLDRDDNGDLCKRHVVRKQIEVPDRENNVPAFHYNKGVNDGRTIEISYMTSVAAGLDVSSYPDFNNLKWREMDFPEVRKELDSVVNIARLIKSRYEDALLSDSSAENISNYDAEIG